MIAGWSGRRLTPPSLPSRYVVGDELHAPGSISAVHTGVLKPSGSGSAELG
jgi:hypothetical protein